MVGVHPAPRAVRVAGVLVALQGLAAFAFAVVLVVQADAAAQPVTAVLGEAVMFLVIGAALAGVGWGLLTGRRGARTPAVVAQLLFLPVVYSLIGQSHQLVLGLLTGAYVAATFLLLISEASRRWAVDPYDRSADS